MIAVRAKDVIAQPESRSVFGHARGGQKGTDGRNTNPAVRPNTGNPATRHGRLPKRMLRRIQRNLCQT